MTRWRLSREDAAPLALVVIAPWLLALPQLIGLLLADPMLYTGAMTVGLERGMVGVPYIDPNSGYSTQALGRLAALQWVQGTVPWWNPYSGVGLPLAAEYHPGAFFPLTALLLLPNGIVFLQAALQSLAGAGTYALLRQLGASRLAAMTGGVLYAFNGTLAWLNHAAAQPVPFLPWMLLGIEHARAGGWRLLAVAMALSLLAGFPETAYINGLLALAWTVTRGLQLAPSERRRYAKCIVAGGIAGIAVAAPQVHSFFEFLLHADLGGHEHRFATEAMPLPSIVPSLVAPYAFGPPAAFALGKPWLISTWGGIGGFVTIAVLLAAAVGAAVRRGEAVTWLLVGWCVLALARTFGVELAASFWNLIPGISLAAFYRYAPPSWELAIVLLAAWGIDGARIAPGRRLALAAAGFLVVLTVLVLWAAGPAWRELRGVAEARPWMTWAAAWVVLSSAAVIFLVARRGLATVLAAVLTIEAMVMVAIPTLSNPRAGAPDIPAIHFLRDQLGLQRFFTLGPIQPNYGAYFRIASINYNYLPNSRRWLAWVRANLDRDADPVVFNGTRLQGQSRPEEELRRNLAGYHEAGVKFVVTFPGQDPLAGVEGVREVYKDAALRIFELPGAKPYFESLAGRCQVRAIDRQHAEIDCSDGDTLVRRELFHPGWRATVNGAEGVLAEHAGVFQSVRAPAGRSVVRFAYAPPNVGWAWLATLIALLGLAAPTLLKRVRRSAASGRSAS